MGEKVVAMEKVGAEMEKGKTRIECARIKLFENTRLSAKSEVPHF
jgi:hypothetical protein